MPIIQGPGTTAAADDFTAWGYVEFPAGMKDVTEPHFHDCDEFVFIIRGRMRMVSEGREYVVGPRDVLVTRMGDEHWIPEVLEDTAYFWAEGPLRGRKRPGHLIRGTHEP